MWHVLTDSVIFFTKTLNGLWNSKTSLPLWPEWRSQTIPLQPWRRTFGEVQAKSLSSCVSPARRNGGVNKEACWSALASRTDSANGCLRAFVGHCSWR